jgi:hypothetical protein
VFLTLMLACALALTPAAAYAAPPANDNFSAAQAFTGTASVPGTNVEATKETGEPNHAGNPGGHSVWYRWTAPSQSGVVFIYTCDSAIDTLMGVYTGSGVSSLTQVAANDDENIGCSPAGPTTQSAVSFVPVQGQTYFIGVDGKNGATGNVNFGVTFTADGGGSAPPSNDNFSAAEDLTPNSDSDTVSTVSATKETGEPSHAGNPGGRSVWYRIQAPTDGNVTLSTCSSNFDTLLAVYTGSSVSALTPVASNDNSLGCGSGGTKSELTFAATAGQSYFVAVDGKGGSSGTARIFLSSDFAISQPPPNDNRAEATLLSGELDSGSITTVDATKEPGEPNHAGNAGGRSVWYRWTAPSNGNVTIDTCASTIDTLLAAYPSGGSTTPVAENDDQAGCGGGTRSSVSFSVTNGQTFDIAVDGKNGAGGSVGLSLTHTPTIVPPPPNDDRASAEVLSGSSASASGTNAGADKEAGEPNHAGNAGGASVWYRWTAPGDGSVTVDSCGSDFDTLLAAYPGNGATSPLAQNDDTSGCGGGTRSRVTFNVNSGAAYDIAVDGKDGGTGSVAISLTFTQAPPTPPAHDNFGSATSLPSGDATATGNTKDAGKEAGEPNHAGNSGGASVWYRWTPPSDGSVAIYTCSSGFDTLLGIYTGASVDALTPVAGNDDTAGCGGGTRSYVTIPVSAGTEYRIAVDGTGGATGPLALTLDFTAAPAGDGGGGGGGGGGSGGGGSGGGGGAGGGGTAEPPPSGGGGTGDSSPSGGNTAPPRLRTSLTAASVRLSRLLSRGVAVTFGCNRTCSASFTLVASGRGLIGRGSAGLRSQGSRRVVIQLNRSARRRLRRARSLRLTLTMRVTDSSGGRSTMTKRLRIRR